MAASARGPPKAGRLEQAGYIRRERDGRRTRYILCAGGTLRHPAEAHVPLRELLDVFTAHDTRN
ncbi:hypothetical protein ABZ835_16270 [Streptomyces sp. NPDC047461]|uniref:hypothetical protein n=1 Tax=Streptomyces sp. NPDC047461 TaxID=3155619 RepID=UPI00340387E4